MIIRMSIITAVKSAADIATSVTNTAVPLAGVGLISMLGVVSLFMPE